MYMLFKRPQATMMFSLSLRNMWASNKFHSEEFLKNQRQYIRRDEDVIQPEKNAPDFIPLEDTYKPPKDDHTRMVVPEVDPATLLEPNDFPLQSAYYAVWHGNTIYHVFDAKRISLGRMAIRIAKYISGKHKPIYDPKKALQLGDKVIVVNGEDIKVTGRKRYQMIFRSHSLYAGGLKEILFKDLMRIDPERLIKTVVRGMLPRNNTRKLLLNNIKVHRGQYHNHQSQKLPQFMNQPLPDLNSRYGTFASVDQSELKIVYESNPEQSPEEFSHIPREKDEKIETPQVWRDLEWMRSYKYKEQDKRRRMFERKLKRYQEHK